MKIHEKYMLRCLQLAKNGLGTTYPNPLVGSVIVLNDIIIGEGFHLKAGQPHAEVNAIANASETSLLKEATIYVNLEPCSHYGKTPPCADLIIEKGIKKVVIGCTDINPAVAGKGVQKLMQAGCDVTIGILEAECLEINKRFFTFHSKKRPYIILKWAQTADGFTAPNSKTDSTEISEKKPFWISNSFSQQYAHKMRAEEHAILVGKNTAITDNPSLTARNFAGENPVRIFIDRNLDIIEKSNLYNEAAETIVITEKAKGAVKNISFEVANFAENLPLQICEILHKKNIQSVIIEGGAKTLQSFIEANLWDEAYIFNGIFNLEKGLKAPELKGSKISEMKLGDDTLQLFKNKL